MLFCTYIACLAPPYAQYLHCGNYAYARTAIYVFVVVMVTSHITVDEHNVD